MFVYDKEDQPYGLLSNFATTPMLIHGTLYNSVAQYIYVSILPNMTVEQKKFIFDLDPKENLEKGIDSLRDYYHSRKDDLFKHAMDQLISAKDIEQFVGKFVDGDDDELVGYITTRASKYNLSKVEIGRIVQGLFEALGNGTNIDDNTPLPELRKYMSIKQYDLDSDVNIMEYLDQLVPYVKFLITNRDEIAAYKKDMNSFKDKLLQKLFMVAAKNLPDPAAVVKENIDRMDKTTYEMTREHYYDKFMTNKFPTDITKDINDELGYPPNKPFFNYVSGIKSKVVISKDSPLDPKNMTEATIDGHKYKSPYHFIVYELMKGQDMTFKPDDYPASKVLDEYAVHLQYDIIPKRLIYYMKTAMHKKFETYPVIGHLLKTTGSEEIIYASAIKPFGGDDNGENATGSYLMHLRSTMMFGNTTYKNPLDNIYLKQWVSFRLNDIFRIMRLFTDRPDSDMLQKLYMFPKTKGIHKPTDDEMQIIKSLFSDIPENWIDVAWTLIYPQYYGLSKLDDSSLTIYVVAAQNRFATSNYFADKVMDFFDQYYEKNKNVLTSNNHFQFAAQVLSGKNNTDAESMVDVTRDAKTSRLAYWQSVTERMRKIEPIVMRV